MHMVYDIDKIYKYILQFKILNFSRNGKSVELYMAIVGDGGVEESCGGGMAELVEMWVQSRTGDQYITTEMTLVNK